jgi:hypothetical protein
MANITWKRCDAKFGQKIFATHRPQNFDIYQDHATREVAKGPAQQATAGPALPSVLQFLLERNLGWKASWTSRARTTSCFGDAARDSAIVPFGPVHKKRNEERDAWI